MEQLLKRGVERLPTLPVHTEKRRLVWIDGEFHAGEPAAPASEGGGVTTPTGDDQMGIEECYLGFEFPYVRDC
jgi:hypothetical protein